MADAPSLQVTELVCGYAERHLFAPVSFTLRPGQALRIAGANGRGKTTLLRTIVGLQRALAGEVRWSGATQLQDALCFVAHANALNAALTPLQNLELLLRLAGHRVSRRAMRDTLASLGLKQLCNRPCGRLSAGQKRRVTLARLWLCQARLWVLDEPAAALDVDARRVLCAQVAAFVEQGGMVLYTTHEPLTLPDIEPGQVALQPC